jgi:hypothetical protein
MRIRPVSLEVLVNELASTIAASSLTRVAVDGAPPTTAGAFADTLAERLRLRGRAVVRVSAADFLRPASLRFERGRYNPDARHDDWLDAGGLIREVLEPAGPGGSGSVLPSLWNTETDRATRADYVRLPPGAVLVVDGELLLGRGLPFDHTVHLWMSAGALTRAMPAAQTWALPAFARYETEVIPLLRADTGVRMDDPAHPAVVDDAAV